MAVSRADKETELSELQAAFREAETAVLVDYRGVTVPQVTELRRQINAAGATYRVVKNTLAKRASAGHVARAAAGALCRHDGGGLHRQGSGGAGQGADDVRQGDADDDDQGGDRAGPAGGGRPP